MLQELQDNFVSLGPIAAPMIEAEQLAAIEHHLSGKEVSQQKNPTTKKEI
jgi:hypothetical protein